MAQTKKKKAKQPGKRRWELSETQRWVCGIVVFMFALFLTVAVVSYYFCWQYDQAYVEWGSVSGPAADMVMNPAGKLGAVLASWIVGMWFGVFGILLPFVLFVLSMRIIRYKPLALNRSIRISLVVMILGSLSMGYLFGTRWEVFGTGLGGSHGIFISRQLESYLGVAGAGLLLALCWILLAVFVNRRSIKLFNRVGKGVLDGGKIVGTAVMSQAGEFIRDKGIDSSVGDELVEEDDPYAAIEPEDQVMPVKEPDAVAPVSGPSVDRAVEMSVAEKNTVVFGEDAAPERSSRESGSDVIEVIRPREEPVRTGDPGHGTPFQVTAPEAFVADGHGLSQIVDLGQPASHITPLAAATSGAVDLDAGTGAYSAVVGQEPFEPPAPVIPQANHGRPAVSPALEVVDREGTKLSVGGVVEAVPQYGSIAGDAMEIVVAGRKDIELAEDEIEDSLYDPTKELSRYQKPPVELLEDHSIDVQVTEEEIYDNKNQIVRTLENFGIRIDKIKATIGPTVTLYEIVPAAGVKISKIKNLEDDIALSLKALGIRIIAPMPGKGTVGIEVPNKDKEVVSMYSVVRTQKFQECGYELPIVLGKTISNETFIIDLAKMPHLLVAGATGQGKSVGLNAIITSLLYRKHPAELKFVLVDPKRVELSLYSKLERHFLAKMSSEENAILTDTQRVVYTLNALCTEMTERYELLRMGEVKKLSEYNEKFLNRRLNPRKGHRFLPYIVVVVDEFADMIMTAGREVEAPITRLAQLARAVGIHLVIATQRPDVKVITGLIKANFPARIAFRVMSMVDSRTIIDQPGANQLIGRGDMLMSLNGELTRVQCAFIDTPEIERITEFISNQRGYGGAYELPDYQPEGDQNAERGMDSGPLDQMFEEVARFVVQNQQGSTSSIQRRFSIGYNRAGRIMDQLEAAGVVGRAEGSKPREVLITDLTSLEYMIGKM